MLLACTFNYKNVKSALDKIKLLCKSNGIILLQEIWLLDSEVHFLSNIDERFYAKGISSIDTGLKIHKGKPHGGLGIVWKKSLSDKCKIVHKVNGLRN